MTVGELIKTLETCPPDMPVATHANNHTYASDPGADGETHGACRVAILDHYAGDHVVIGNMSSEDLNPPNWFVSEWLDGQQAPA